MKSKALFKQLCSNTLLLRAWSLVKQKGSCGGIDGVSITEFDEHLGKNINKLISELKNKSWNPEPYLQIKIPKKQNEKRTLGLLSIKDKIVQQAIKLLIEPRFEKLFKKNSYGYRPGKGHSKAIGFTRNISQNKKCKFILRLDIDNYFDTINHELLFKRAFPIIADDEVFRLVQMCIKMGMVNKNLKWTDVVAGVPQGAVLSPLFANLYLHSFDQFILSRTELYVRYADDFIIGCESQEQAEALLLDATTFLQQRLKLKLNTPEIIETSKGFEFLGIMITNKGLSLSQLKQEDLHNRLRIIDWDNNSFSKEGIEKIQGIKNYYAKLLPEVFLEEFDNTLFSHLINVITNKWELMSNKTTLKEALKEVQFFSKKSIFERSKIIQQLLNHYIELKSAQTTSQNTKLNKKLISQRKHEYRRKENENSELIISSYGTYIGVSNNGITIKINGERQNINSGNLRHITITCEGVSISSNAIAYCMQNNIGIDFFSPSGKHEASVLSNAIHQSLLWKKQSMMSIEKRKKLAINIISGKLRNQLNLIKYFHKYHKSVSKDLVLKYDAALLGIGKILEVLKKINADDYRASIISLEAQGADLYWNYIKELIKDDNVGFSNRTRHGATDLVNCMLNYGYAILYARVWRTTLQKRLNPSESIIHVPQNNKPTFIYDIIELFRSQAVDRVVISLIQKKTPLSINKNGMLDDNTKNHLIQSISERMVRYERYRSVETKFSDIITRQINDIASYINNDSNFKPYIAKW